MDDGQINEDLFQDLVESVLPDRLITNFLVIAEVMDDTNQELSIVMSDGMTPWLAVGMLKSAVDMINGGQVRPTRYED